MPERTRLLELNISPAPITAIEVQLLRRTLLPGRKRLLM